jgi:alpha-1,3/alpha-1,6-mannosyltransferase
VLAVRVGETGYLCEQTPEAFAAAMLKFVQQPALTATMGGKGQQHVTNSFGLKVRELDMHQQQLYLYAVVALYPHISYCHLSKPAAATALV